MGIGQGVVPATSVFLSLFNPNNSCHCWDRKAIWFSRPTLECDRFSLYLWHYFRHSLLAASLSAEAPPWVGPLPPPPPPRGHSADGDGEEDNLEDEEIGRALQDALGGPDECSGDPDECSFDEYCAASPVSLVSHVSEETDSEEMEMDSEEKEEQLVAEVDQEKDEQVVDEEKDQEDQVVDQEKEEVDEEEEGTGSGVVVKDESPARAPARSRSRRRRRRSGTPRSRSRRRRRRRSSSPDRRITFLLGELGRQMLRRG